MIQFKIADQRLRAHGFDEACAEIQYQLGQCMSNQALRAALSAMTFDHRFTKPIDLNGLDIATILASTNKIITLDTYTQNYWKWRTGPVNAYVTASRRDHIFFNTRQVPRRALISWKETIYHELVHVADAISPLVFSHGSNSLRDKKNSAPVKWADFMVTLRPKNKEVA